MGQIWGFINGKFQGFCQSIFGQEIDYSGYKEYRLQCQGVVTLDGLIISLDELYLGSAADYISFQ